MVVIVAQYFGGPRVSWEAHQGQETSPKRGYPGFLVFFSLGQFFAKIPAPLFLNEFLGTDP